MSRVSTKTGLANLTAGLLKVDAVTSIDPPDKNSKFAKKAAQWIDEARREVLQDHIWNFAETEVILPISTDAPVTGKYSAKYLLPADYIRVSWLVDEDYPEKEYKVKNGYIYTNTTGSLPCGYIFDQEDITKMTPNFIQLWARKLAAYLAYDMTGNRSMAVSMEEAYQEKASDAKGVDGQESPPPPKRRESKWRAAKEGRTSLGDTYQGRVVT